jgi:hypothetical protein
MVSRSSASAPFIHSRHTQIHIVHPVSLRSSFLTIRVKRIAEVASRQIAPSAAASALNKKTRRGEFLCNRRPVMGRIVRRGTMKSMVRPIALAHEALSAGVLKEPL